MSYKLILELWAQQPGKFFNLSTKSGAGKWKDHFFSREEFGKVKDFIKDYDDHDIYFCPHGFNRRVRRKEEAVIPNLLYADLDFADPREMKPKPSIAIQSSPGRYVGIWLLKDLPEDWESVNRRLTYFVDADHGGWDLSQVLRMPGTHNYKYKSQPRVRVLWDDGRAYKTSFIESFLPKDEKNEGGETLSAADVWLEYENKLPRWARRELTTKTMKGQYDRSEMLWKLENACIEAGMTTDEALALVKRSVWNKFAGRRNEDEQLRRELDKIVEHQFKEKPKGADKRHMKSDEEESQDEKKTWFKLTPMKDVKREEIDFLWYPYLARGEVTILEGDPGLGKSYLAQMVAGSIAVGKRLPSHRKGMGKAQGPVLYFDMENSRGTVTKPRLEDNGFIDMDNYYQVEEGFSIDDDDAMDEIYEHMEQIRPAVVVFDTLNAYIGRADTHNASEARQAFGRFYELARDFKCAVLVIRHLTKGSGSAMYRGQGSIAFSGTARVVMSVGVDPADTDIRVIAVTKINYAPQPPALSYTIIGTKKDSSKFEWGGFSDLTAQEVMDAASEARASGSKGESMQEAMEFLENTITGVELEESKLYRMAEKRSVSRKTLDRAVTKMDVTKKKKKGVTFWSLPEREDDAEEKSSRKRK